MNIIKIKQLIIGIAILLSVAGLATATITPAAGTTDRVLDLPEQCGQINVPEDNNLAYHVYATGVQVYWSNGTSWGFVGPMADLYADATYQGKLGRHYGGPTWKSNSGGLVIGKKEKECSVDPNSIAWLLLSADEVDGVGMFSDVTYIQRVNTSGGKAPTYTGYDGEEVSVPYTAEYYFYRKAR